MASRVSIILHIKNEKEKRLFIKSLPIFYFNIFVFSNDMYKSIISQDLWCTKNC